MTSHLNSYEQSLLPVLFKLFDHGWTYSDVADILLPDAVSETACAVWRLWAGTMQAHWSDLRVTPTLSFP
eukprot:16431709-Heterocapsa_arctica.AAC.1